MQTEKGGNKSIHNLARLVLLVFDVILDAFHSCDFNNRFNMLSNWTGIFDHTDLAAE